MEGWLYTVWIEPWRHPYFVKAALSGSIVAVTCGVLGCYVILRRMAFIGDAMSHALLPGVGVGYLAMYFLFEGGFSAGGLLLGALAAALLTSLGISFLSRIQRIREDTAIGVVYTGLFAAGVVILTRFQKYITIDINHFFQGDILGISWPDLWLGAAIASGVLSVIVIFYRQLMLASFDPIMAASIGLPVRWIDTVLMMMIALVCVAAISMVGVIMVVGLLITPAALAHLLSDRLQRMMILSGVFGILSVILGLYVSEWVNASGGGSIMLTGSLLFLVGLLVAPRHGIIAGWVRRWRTVPESDAEDVLKAFFEGTAVPFSGRRRLKALRMLKSRGMVEGVQLTDRGRAEAAHVLRSHQLWEGMLVAGGMAPAEAHSAAERLEHIHEREVLDAFDDDLEHPVTDSHGVVIPGEVVDVGDEHPEVVLSLLRVGDRGVFLRCDGDWPAGLSGGAEFALRPRDEDTNRWHVVLVSGDEVLLSHAEADRLVVEPRPRVAS
ncbi:iron chelate uptake ABC transporter family permease subunit [Planctomycetota bacterium]